MELKYLALPVVGALIGWLTNLIAIKLIFRPFQPIKIPFTNFEFQGLIPKRRDEIAITVGSLVEEQLLSVDDVVDLVDNKKTKRKLVDYLIPELKKNFRDRLPAFIPSRVKESVTNIFEEILKKETPEMVGKISSDISQEVRGEIEFGPIVQDKIKAFDLYSLENMVLQLVSKELKHIEILGAILGFVIGIIQLFIMIYIV